MKLPVLLFLLGFHFLSGAQSSDTLTYARQELLIPMRDGVKLNTVIYAPQKTQTLLPILFRSTILLMKI